MAAQHTDSGNRSSAMPTSSASPLIVTIPVTDLDRAVGDFESSGFRLEEIGPADAPRYAIVAGTGGRFRLDVVGEGEAGPPRLESPDPDRWQSVAAMVHQSEEPVVWPSPELVVSAPDDAGLGAGRAGMSYRDLIPGRFGGAVIASHINVAQGGPVPDYVHHHQIDFQLIYCHRGWVDVVYQDQGPPIRLEPGDLFLQPPGIRHQVLECSPDLWVVEVTSPAEHPTRLDHDMALPNQDQASPGRLYGGQHFVFHDASASAWQPDPSGRIEWQSLGLGRATGGLIEAKTLASSDGGRWELGPRSGRDLVFVMVLDGAATLTLRPGSASTGQSSTYRLGTDWAVSVPGSEVAVMDLEPGTRLFELEARLQTHGRH